MQSLLQPLGPVSFPTFAGERHYMVPFLQREGLPAHLSRWQPTVDQMLRHLRAPGVIYLMIDQACVAEGHTHRRAGAHIDGYWNPLSQRHDKHTPPTKPVAGDHEAPTPSHIHPGAPVIVPTTPGIHSPWPLHEPPQPEPRPKDEALILASNVEASVAYVGEVNGWCREGGDCSHLDLSVLSRIPLLAGQAYVGNVTMIHESLPVLRTCRRTLVRLNVPGLAIAA